MKVLAIVGKYPPVHNAGAEVMLHVMLRDLVERGHEAIVTYPAAKDRELDGVEVVGAPFRDLRAMAAKADVVISHLDLAPRASQIAGSRPLVQILHNDRQQLVRSAALVVVNSEWIAREYSGWKGELEIVRPPVWVADYEVPSLDGSALNRRYTQLDTPRSDIALINLTQAKGGNLLWELAGLMPERRFLAVRGAYGNQIVHQRHNVEMVAHTPDVVEQVYARTRVLLVPSQYESWGRVAIEAACSGIPVIAHPTPGLLEALGEAGIFADRRKANDWRRALDALDDPSFYAEASQRARARAEELDVVARADLDRFHRRLVDLVAA